MTTQNPTASVSSTTNEPRTILEHAERILSPYLPKERGHPLSEAFRMASIDIAKALNAAFLEGQIMERDRQIEDSARKTPESVPANPQQSGGDWRKALEMIGDERRTTGATIEGLRSIAREALAKPALSGESKSEYIDTYMGRFEKSQPKADPAPVVQPWPQDLNELLTTMRAFVESARYTTSIVCQANLGAFASQNGMINIDREKHYNDLAKLDAIMVQMDIMLEREQWAAQSKAPKPTPSPAPEKTSESRTGEDIKRYDMRAEWCLGVPAVFSKEACDGAWVNYHDVSPIISRITRERDELKKRQTRLTAVINYAIGAFDPVARTGRIPIGGEQEGNQECIELAHRAMKHELAKCPATIGYTSLPKE